MTERGRAGEQNLTGVWNGLYTYPNGRSTSFVATLIDSGGSLSGTTHEPGLAGGTLSWLSAGLSQRQIAVWLSPRPTSGPTSCIASRSSTKARLNGDATEIEGRWTIAESLVGQIHDGSLRRPGGSGRA